MDEPKEKPQLPRSITAPFDALTVDSAQPSQGDSAGRRPLLELFPSKPKAASERRPVPAAEPQLRVERRTAPRDAAGAAPGSAEAFYGLREKAFSQAPDPRFFYHSKPHDLVTQQLLTAIRERQGLAVVTGDLGVGKTTICRVMLEELDRRMVASHVTDPSVSAEELLTHILCDFGVLAREEVLGRPLSTRAELTAQLQSFIESLTPPDSRAFVIVDDAHTLTGDALEQVRLLCEAANASSLLQIVLVGQPSMSAMLKRPENKTIRQRAAVRCTLEPLPREDVAPYIDHRLAVASEAYSIEFDEAGVERIYQLTRGVPRVINLLCDRALVRGYEVSAAIITDAIVDEAAQDLDISRSSPLRAAGARLAFIAALIAFLLLGAGAAAWVFRDAVARVIAQWK